MQAAIHQTIERIRTAVQERTPLCICGGGSKAFYTSNVQAQTLSTADLQGIVSYEPSELVVTVRSGTRLAELEAALSEHGQCLAFEPPHFASEAGSTTTVGGMVAAGWSGPSRASVGAVRDFVLGAEIINGRGELLRFGGTVMKNVAGYDVARLMAGSWGTLGLLTEISLKVLPVAPAEATLRFDDMTQEQALQSLNQWGGQPLPLSASRWSQEGEHGVLHVRLRGAAAAVQAACQRMGGVRLPAQEAAADWQACREQTLAWFRQRVPGHALWRLSVPQAAPALQLPTGSVALLEWHGAQRWVQAPQDAAALLHAVAQDVGGHASLFRAISPRETLPSAVFGSKNPALQRVHQQLKQAFDPAGIFNPHQAAVL